MFIAELDLHDLKERAFQVNRHPKQLYYIVDRSQSNQHIEKSLTVQNIAYEVFSPFSAAFADIRKVISY